MFHICLACVGGEGHVSDTLEIVGDKEVCLTIDEDKEVCLTIDEDKEVCFTIDEANLSEILESLDET